MHMIIKKSWKFTVAKVVITTNHQLRCFTVNNLLNLVQSVNYYAKLVLAFHISKKNKQKKTNLKLSLKPPDFHFKTFFILIKVYLYI